ncbi:hypothetical protein ACF0H5_005552 [Mactra antiquata]
MDSEGTSTSTDQDRMEACQSAVNIIAQGKRNMVCGEIPTAVNQFQEACRILSKTYGETAKECADAYFCYGQALLDLARMENGVLGNALQGVPDTDDETTEQKDEQFEKGELEVTEREKLRKEVYDAMGEKEQEKSDREKKELDKKKDSGETMEVAMDTEEKGKEEKAEKDDKEKPKEDKEDKSDKKEEKELKKDEKLDETDKKKDEDKEKDKDEIKKDEEKMETEEKSKDAKEKADAKKDEEEESAEDGEGTEEEGEGTEEEGEGTEEEGEAAEGEAASADDGETTSQDGSQDGENPDDVSNLQLAWEMLELAKIIYLKDESKEAKLRVAESHLKLGEVSLETEQYEEAIKDLNSCLTIQKELLDPNDRLLAETHYQLGLAHCFNKQFKESTESYQAAIKVFEDRIAALNIILDKATDEEKNTSDFDSPVYKAKKEVDELKEILPDIKAKIEDVEDERKNTDELKNLAKEALSGLTSSSSSAGPAKETPKEEEKVASDISHLVKRKRKSEDPVEETVKKAKQDEKGDGDAKVNGTTQEKESMDTKS